MEPTVIPVEVSCEISKMPPTLVMKRAWPPVLVSKNCVNPPEVLMVALPAVLLPWKDVEPPEFVVIVALPAVLPVLKVV
jgi:hypothetical protein